MTNVAHGTVLGICQKIQNLIFFLRTETQTFKSGTGVLKSPQNKNKLSTIISK